MRTTIIICITLFFVSSAFAQEAKVEKWKSIVSQGKKDTTTLILIDSLCNWFGSHRTDTGIYYIAQMKALAEYLHNKQYIISALRLSAEGHFTKGKTAEALKEQYEALGLAEELRDSGSVARGYASIGNSHLAQVCFGPSGASMFGPIWRKFVFLPPYWRKFVWRKCSQHNH